MKNLILILSVFMFVSCNQDDDLPTPTPTPTPTAPSNSNFPADLIGLWDLNYTIMSGGVNFYTGTTSKVEFTDTPFPNLPNGYYISYGKPAAFYYPSQHQWSYNTGNQLIDNLYTINSLTSSSLELQYSTNIYAYSKANWIPTTITIEIEFSSYPTGLTTNGLEQIFWTPGGLEALVPGQLNYSKTVSYVPNQSTGINSTIYYSGVISTDITITKRIKIDNILIGTSTQTLLSGTVFQDSKPFSLTFINL